MICSVCGNEMSDGARFCSACGRPVMREPYEPIRTYEPARTRLVRPRQGRMIAGVCMGFARNYGWDVVIVRLVLCLAVLFGAGIPLIAYVIAWIVMPDEPHLLPPTTASAGSPPGSSVS